MPQPPSGEQVEITDASARYRAVLVALAGGLGLGVLTSFGQQWLPESVGPLANSASSWALPGFLLALRARTRGSAALAGVGALAFMLLGYVLASALRGYPSSAALLIFWGAAAILVGPLLGIGAYWLRWARGPRAALGIGGMCGIVVGEGAYGVLYIAETTSPPYWWTQISVGLALLLVTGGRLRPWSTAAASALVTAAVAVLFVFAYANSGAVMSVL